MKGLELLRLEVRDQEQETTSLRHVGRRAGRLLGLDDYNATRVSTALSEIGRLAQVHPPVVITFAAGPSNKSTRSSKSGKSGDANEPYDLVVSFHFDDAERALEADPQMRGGLGRLMDSVVVETGRLTVRKVLPRAFSDAELEAARDELLRESGADHRAILGSLNDELVLMLTTLREREAELVQVNTELDHTNRGVVALYAELEQRSEQVRTAQRAVFEELGRALRPPPPVVPGLELAVTYLPAQVDSPTGGDLYDWFMMPDGRVHFTVVDVRGHGVTGTRDALHVTHAVRTLVLQGYELGELLHRTDTILHATNSGVVATALVAQLDVTTGTLQVAGAGHPPALLIPPKGSATYLEAAGRPIGYAGGGSRGVSTASLTPGEAVLFYTDGLIEIRHDIVEGLETLAAAATGAQHLELSHLLDATLFGCSYGVELDDDTLLIAARWTPDQPAGHVVAKAQPA